MARGLLGYLLMQNHFVFLDYQEPPALFYADYLAVMSLMILCAYYTGRRLNRRKQPGYTYIK